MEDTAVLSSFDKYTTFQEDVAKVFMVYAANEIA